MPSSPRSMPDMSNGAAPRACGWTSVAMARRYASQSERDPVLAPVAAADERVAGHQDRLAAAEEQMVALGAHLQAGGREAGGIEAGLEREDLAVDAKPRAVQRGLRVQAVVDEPADELKVCLGLEERAHDPERPEQLAVAQQQSRDERVVRARPRHDLALDGEPRGAVVEHDPGAGRHDARAEAAEQA